ncbi:MAG TPA: trigger factor [Planctomycetota bacterium]|nr:trigger factor [Planctomycetota bacterium]
MTEDPEKQKEEEVAKATEAVAAAEAEEEEVPKIEGLEAEVDETGPCKVSVKVRVPKTALDAECAKTFDELTPNAAIPGFRKGHAPRKLVERHYHDVVFEDVKRLLVARSWDQVRKEHEIRPVGDPDLADDKIQYDEEQGLSYDLDLEIAPKFDVTDYKGLELTKPPVEVDEEEVVQILESLRKRNAVLEPVEKGNTKQDDVPVVDCDITVAGEVIQSVSDQEIRLSEDNWLRGLDPELWKDLLGKKPGEAATRTVTLPKTYQKEEYREKEAEVTVTIKDVKRPRLPELDDEFAKNLLFENLEDLRTNVREQVAGRKEQDAQAGLARQVEEKLLERVDFGLPEGLVKRMSERTANRQRLGLAYQGVPRDEIEKAGQQIAKGAAQKTERDMRIYFIMQQIAEKEDISVSESEVERRIQLIAQHQGMRPGRLREELRREGRLELLQSEIQDEKTMAFLIAEAKIEGAAAETRPPVKPKKPKGTARKRKTSPKTDESEEKT